MSAPPTLQIGVKEDGSGMIHPESFERFERWMRLNDAQFALVNEHAEALALTGEDRLRYLLAGMCLSSRNWSAAAHEATRRAAAFGFPFSG